VIHELSSLARNMSLSSPDQAVDGFSLSSITDRSWRVELGYRFSADMTTNTKVSYDGNAHLPGSMLGDKGAFSANYLCAQSHDTSLNPLSTEMLLR
jgi:hypothetical protein